MKLLNAASVLKLVRDRGELSLQDIAEAFGAPVWPQGTTFRFGDPLPASGPVNSLVEAGLLRLRLRDTDTQLAELKVSAEPPANVLVSMADREAWLRIQQALGLSLTELADRQAGAPTLHVTPSLGLPSPKPHADYPQVLVLMPFAETLRPVFALLREVVLSCELSVGRADDFIGEGVIMNDIWTAICQAKLVIADCTDLNPNVFYELGLANTVGVPTLLIARSDTEIPFDIRHQRLIAYELDKLHELRIKVERWTRAGIAALTQPGSESSRPRPSTLAGGPVG